MRTYKQQYGASFLGVVIIIAMVMALGLFAAKTGPLFMDNASVNTAVENLVGIPNIGKKGKKKMIDMVDRQLNIDSVKHFQAKELVFTKSKTKKVWIVTADYEAREVLLKNISVVVHFTKTVEVPR